MHKATNLSSIRTAARKACTDAGVSIKAENVEVLVLRFTGTINDRPVTETVVYNVGHKWYHGQEIIRFISGTYTEIIVLH